MDLDRFLAGVAFMISIVNLIMIISQYLLRKRTVFPTMEAKLYNLPPYKEDDDETFLVLRNIGTSIAYKISAEIEFSYSEKKLSVELGKDYILAMSESVKEYLKFPPPNQKKAYIEIIVKFHWKRWFGGENTYTERIYLEEFKESNS